MATLRKKQGIWVVNIRASLSDRTVERAIEQVRSERLLHILDSNKTVWDDKDHPELAGGAATWVRKLRSESRNKVAPLSGGRPTRRAEGRSTLARDTKKPGKAIH